MLLLQVIIQVGILSFASIPSIGLKRNMILCFHIISVVLVLQLVVSQKRKRVQLGVIGNRHIFVILFY